MDARRDGPSGDAAMVIVAHGCLQLQPVATSGWKPSAATGLIAGSREKKAWILRRGCRAVWGFSLH
jgi:hypothetical protein